MARRRLGNLLSCNSDSALTGQQGDPDPMLSGDTGAPPVAYACMIDTQRGTDFAVGPDLFEQGSMREAGAHSADLNLRMTQGSSFATATCNQWLRGTNTLRLAQFFGKRMCV